MFSSLKRSQIINQMANTSLDLLILGGGITGAGIALDAASRGMKVALIDMQDFSSGTSSRSTKLIHGGLRYLKQFEIKVVSEVGKERSIVYENGPHVTTPEWMMLPLYKNGTFGPLLTNLGLKFYDYLAGVKKDERRQMLSPEETRRKEPLLKQDGLLGAGYYVEYRTDDARLTIEVLKKAVEKGALAINYVKAKQFIYSKGKVCGVEIEDQINQLKQSFYAKKIVNATGPWVDSIRDLDQSKEGRFLHLTKGVHLVFDKKRFPLRQAIYFDNSDGRMIFAIPRGEKTYVGTTDTVYKGNLINPKVTVTDRDYLIHAINHVFPNLNIGPNDVESSWAGLRPLILEEGKSPSEISRKDEIFISRSGLISIAGGKLTGYRKMAEKIVNLIVKQLRQESGIIFPETKTKHIPISGGEVGGSKGFQKFLNEMTSYGIEIGLKKRTAKILTRRYGSNVKCIYSLLQNEKSGNRWKIDPLLYATLMYSIENELSYKPTDFFIRRTGALFFDIDWVKKHKDNVLVVLSDIFNWTEDQQLQYSNELNDAIFDAINPVPEERN